jgi:beta-glucanase (GH16 family)
MSIGELPFEVILEKIAVLTNEIRSIQDQVSTINNQINNFTSRINNLETKTNNLETRINGLASAIQSIDVNIGNIWDQLATCLRKVNPIPGYNPYNLTGTVTAKVWMYEITPINDNNIKFYYVQFNEISGPSGGISSWIPFPSNITFNHFVYTLHPDFHIGGLLVGAPTIPAAYSTKGISYRLNIAIDEVAFRLIINAGSPEGNDYIGFLIIGNK